MIINDIWFDLKDGRRALLCSPKEEHAESTLEYLKISAAETEFILRYPEECGSILWRARRSFSSKEMSLPMKP